MAARNDNAIREQAAARRSIAFGLSILRIVGETRVRYLLQSESDMTLEQVEEFLDMLEAPHGGES